MSQRVFDVIIVGGSYAGLSAAMALGRSLREVLVIDSGKPCNRFTPHSHNLITQDGSVPALITKTAREQVAAYKTVQFVDDIALSGKKEENGFVITTQGEGAFKAKKLIFATGLKDIMPPIEGFAACWGKTVIHCPYCHGYEVRNEKTGILANGDVAFHYAKLISNWTKDLHIFTNGAPDFSTAQYESLRKHNIPVIDKKITRLQEEGGRLRQLIFNDGSAVPLNAIYAHPKFEQHCNIPEELGCAMTEQGHVKVDPFLKTSLEHVFCCGDSSSPFRAVSNAIAMGGVAGVKANNELIEESF